MSIDRRKTEEKREWNWRDSSEWIDCKGIFYNKKFLTTFDLHELIPTHRGIIQSHLFFFAPCFVLFNIFTNIRDSWQCCGGRIDILRKHTRPLSNSSLLLLYSIFFSFIGLLIHFSRLIFSLVLFWRTQLKTKTIIMPVISFLCEEISHRNFFSFVSTLISWDLHIWKTLKSDENFLLFFVFICHCCCCFCSFEYEYVTRRKAFIPIIFVSLLIISYVQSFMMNVLAELFLQHS